MTLAAKSTATEYAACYYLTHAQFVATTEFGYIIIIFIIRKICQCPYYSQEHRCMTLYMWKPVLRILSEFAASHNSTDLQSADEVDVMVYLQTTSYRIGTGYEAQWPLCTFFIIKHSLYLIVKWTRSQCSSCRWGVCVCNVECRRWAMQRRSDSLKWLQCRLGKACQHWVAVVQSWHDDRQYQTLACQQLASSTNWMTLIAVADYHDNE